LKKVVYNKSKSSRWYYWKSVIDIRRCEECKEKHGKIYSAAEVKKGIKRPHFNCRCLILHCNTILAGNATEKGNLGADWYIKYYGYLPDYYISKAEAISLGWIGIKGNLSEVATGKMIGGDRYYNDKGRLPSKEGRIWYEADIDYDGGYRNQQRILYSNDGLIFVTYDHYKTFIEIL